MNKQNNCSSEHLERNPNRHLMGNQKSWAHKCHILVGVQQDGSRGSKTGEGQVVVRSNWARGEVGKKDISVDVNDERSEGVRAGAGNTFLIKSCDYSVPQLVLKHSRASN